MICAALAKKFYSVRIEVEGGLTCTIWLSFPTRPGALL
jgi:hypothetical protein